MNVYQEIIKHSLTQRIIQSHVSFLSDMCFNLAVEAGWSNKDEPLTDKHKINTALVLIHSEISEAAEGVRKDLMDDKLPHRKMVEVELADAFIRIANLAGEMRLDLGGAVADKLLYNVTRKDHQKEARESIGGKAY